MPYQSFGNIPYQSPPTLKPNATIRNTSKTPVRHRGHVSMPPFMSGKRELVGL